LHNCVAIKTKLKFFFFYIKVPGENDMTKLMKALGNFFTLEPNSDRAIKEWLQTEYKKDWHAAYVQFKQDGTLPNFVRRTL
jgi:hypothetical protein